MMCFSSTANHPVDALGITFKSLGKSNDTLVTGSRLWDHKTHLWMEVCNTFWNERAMLGKFLQN